MIKVIIFLLVCSLATAEECRGRIIDSSGNPLSNASFQINGVATPISSEGQYTVNLAGSPTEYSYQISFSNGDKLIYNSLHPNVNFQLTKDTNNEKEKKYADARLILHLTQAGEFLDRADVNLWTINSREAFAQPYEIRTYSKGNAEYLHVDPGAWQVINVSFNNSQYVIPEQNLVPGVTKEILLELTNFQAAGNSVAAAFFADEQWYYLPVSGNMYVSGNIQPVYVQNNNGVQRYSVGDPQGFPTDKAQGFYNFRQTIYTGPTQTIVFSATGTKAYAEPAPGKIIFDAKLKLAADTDNFTNKQFAACRNYEVIQATGGTTLTF